MHLIVLCGRHLHGYDKKEETPPPPPADKKEEEDTTTSSSNYGGSFSPGVYHFQPTQAGWMNAAGALSAQGTACEKTLMTDENHVSVVGATSTSVWNVQLAGSKRLQGKDVPVYLIEFGGDPGRCDNTYLSVDSDCNTITVRSKPSGDPAARFLWMFVNNNGTTWLQNVQCMMNNRPSYLTRKGLNSTDGYTLDAMSGQDFTVKKLN
jgi:hypothetical protein